MVALMVVMTSLCSMSFAEDVEYSDNLIPIMTSNTTPSGIANASDFWAGTPYGMIADQME